jgi:hypothetical protein
MEVQIKIVLLLLIVVAFTAAGWWIANYFNIPFATRYSTGIHIGDAAVTEEGCGCGCVVLLVAAMVGCGVAENILRVSKQLNAPPPQSRQRQEEIVNTNVPINTGNSINSNVAGNRKKRRSGN